MWVQEEPSNQGAWPFLKVKLPTVVGNLPPFDRFSRRSMSAPATGVSSVSRAEQTLLMDTVFNSTLPE